MSATPLIYVRCIATGEALSPEILAWLREGFACYLAGDVSLTAALRMDRQSQIRQRNQALLRASFLLDDGSGLWVLAGRMAAAVAYFESRIWPRLQIGQAPILSDLDVALFAAFVCESAPRMRCQRAFYDLLAD